MKRQKLLKIVNVILGILFFNMAVTGLLADQIPYDIYQWLHGQTGKVFVFFALAHLALNWNWVKNVLLKKQKTRKPTV